MKNTIFIIVIGLLSLLVGCRDKGSKDKNEAVAPEVTSETAIVKDSVWLNEKFFPDEGLRTALCEIMPLAEGQVIPNRYLGQMRTLILDGLGIKSLKGIEYFPNLEVLACKNNELTNIDVSKNAKLLTLACDNNQLKAIDVTHNLMLTQLMCSDNELTSIDVVKNTELHSLFCHRNHLVSINVAHNENLRNLGVNDNELIELDVTRNLKLERLYCDNNKLKELDLSNNSQLKELFCEKQKGKNIYIIPPANNPKLDDVKRNFSSGGGYFWWPNVFD